MNKIKIKYCVAVAVVMIATAFSGCSGDEEIISLDEARLDEDSLLTRSLYDDGGVAGNATSGDSLGGASNGVENSASGDFVSSTSVKAADEESICIYVCGAVVNPGVYKLSGDIRMIDAIDAAGGMKEDAGSQYLNLASRVSDGVKIYVPTQTEVEEAFASGDDEVYSVVTLSPDGVFVTSDDALTSDASQTGDSSSGGLVNLNTATRESLMTLPGIGESKADKIIEYRKTNGGFSTTEDLMLISGIKEGLYNKVKDSICVK